MAKSKQDFLLNEEVILQLFSLEAFLPVNKQLLKTYGPNTTIFICYLIETYKEAKKNNQIVENHWFPISNETIINYTGISRHHLIDCKIDLKKIGIIEFSKKGMPASTYYKINMNVFVEWIKKAHIKIDQPSGRNYRRHDSGTTANNTLLINNNNKIDLNIGDKKSKSTDIVPKRKIVPPLLEWVIEYCEKRNNKVDPETWYNFYKSKNWQVGKNRMTDWQAAVLTWERKDSQTKNWKSGNKITEKEYVKHDIKLKS